MAVTAMLMAVGYLLLGIFYGSMIKIKHDDHTIDSDKAKDDMMFLVGQWVGLLAILFIIILVVSIVALLL